MTCPSCRSSRVHGPVYYHQPGGRTATMLCRNCQGAFDAYELFGLSSSTRSLI